MRSAPLEHHRTTHLDRFREKLAKPITYYLTGLNAFLLGFLGAVLIGGAGAVAGVLLAVGGALVAIWISSGSAADLDFIERYARARGFTVQPRYRLPKVTPLLDLGGPMLPDGVGYPSREFHGPLRLEDGTEARCIHATNWLTYQTEPRAFEAAPVNFPAVTMFLVDLPATTGDLGLIVCDSPDGPGTRIACDRLPSLRRLGRDRDLLSTYSIFVEQDVTDQLVMEILAGSQDMRFPATTSWQVERGHLLVWRMGRIEAADVMDAALEDVAILANSVLAAASRESTKQRPVVSPRPVDPGPIPEPWRELARKRELEYWHHSAVRPETALGSVHPFCGHTLAGSLDGRDCSISWVKFVDAVQSETQHRTVSHSMIVLSTVIPEARDVLPSVSCTSRRSRYKPFPPPSTQGIEPRPSWHPMAQESVRFHRRYVVRGPSDDENMLRQLFAPAFLLWHAELELDSFGWQFADGVFVAHTLPGRIDVGALNQLCDAGLHVADRILQEGLEGRY